jgi:hypothetical protein
MAGSVYVLCEYSSVPFVFQRTMKTPGFLPSAPGLGLLLFHLQFLGLEGVAHRDLNQIHAMG